MKFLIFSSCTSQDRTKSVQQNNIPSLNSTAITTSPRSAYENLFWDGFINTSSEEDTEELTTENTSKTVKLIKIKPMVVSST